MRFLNSVLILTLLGASVFAQTGQTLPQPQAQPRADALLLYNQGRNLELAGKLTESTAKYQEAIAVCDRELTQDPARMDAYTVKCWSLFRLSRYREVVDVGAGALKVKFDPRIVEVMGEAYFHLGDDATALRYLQRYIDNVGEWGERVATAYFYMAESYLRMRKFDHADIAYAMAVHREPGLARWWFRYAGAVEALGDNPRAFDLYGRALKLNPGMVEAQQGQARTKARL